MTARRRPVPRPARAVFSRRPCRRPYSTEIPPVPAARAQLEHGGEIVAADAIKRRRARSTPWILRRAP